MTTPMTPTPPPPAPMGAPQAAPNYPMAPQQAYYPQQQPRPAAQPKLTAVWLLGLASVLATVLGLTIDEDGSNQWSRVHAWGAVAIVAAVATLAPACGRALSMSAERAWQVAACGAGGLVLFWVLFTLPYVGSNTSLLVTVGVAAGAGAVWQSPGRVDAPRQQGW